MIGTQLNFMALPTSIFIYIEEIFLRSLSVHLGKGHSLKLIELSKYPLWFSPAVGTCVRCEYYIRRELQAELDVRPQ